MFEMKKYEEAFKRGWNYVLYGSEKETREQPQLDKSNLESIGYYDGYQYGEYCEMAGLTMSISQEQLIAVIDKYHTNALKTQQEYVKYSRYKDGFIAGKNQFFDQLSRGDTSIDPKIFDTDEEDDYQVGYYDGYYFSLTDPKNPIFNSNDFNDFNEFNEFNALVEAIYNKRQSIQNGERKVS